MSDNRNVKIIISPAKKMKVRDDHQFSMSEPRYKNKRDVLFNELACMSKEELQALYNCSTKTLDPVYDELCRQKSGVLPPLTPALLAYDGIAFQYMAPGIFSDGEWTYVNDHLRILSGMYGILCPLDGVVPYRLEMGQKLSVSMPHDLGAYWKETMCEAFKDEVIINLASKEYSSAIPKTCIASMIDVRFFEEDETGKRKEKGVYAKMARGSMVRYLAQNGIETPEGMKDFAEMGYAYDEEASTPLCYVFVRSIRKEG